MKFRLIPIVLVCALLSISALGQITGKNRWSNVKSKNFNIIGDASEKELRDVATKLEQFRETFRIIFKNMNLNSPTETNVVVFRSSSSYRPFKPKRPDGKPDDGIAGYFQPGEARNYITLSTEGSREDTYGTIFHEYVHYLMDTNLGRSKIPAWFNEGIAEYYQTFRIVDDQKVYLGDLQNGHLSLMNNAKLIPFKDFLNVTNYSLAGGGHSRSIFYAQAWAFIHFLIHGNNGVNSDGLNKYVSLLQRNIDEEKAFREAFSTDYASMERDLQKYLKKNSYVGTVFDLGKKLTFDTEMSAAPVSEADANAYLGDLLYHGQEYTSAEKYLNRALEIEPGSSFAQTSLGLVKMRQRNFAEAKKLLESAIAAPTADHYTHYSYAQVVSRESTDEFGYVKSFPESDFKSMKASLKRSIELKPDFAESYRLLAWVNSVNGVDLKEAEQILFAALKIQPGNEHYILLMARIMMNQQRFADARTLADRIAKTASNPEMKSEAEQLLSAMVQMEAANKFNEQQRTSMEAMGIRRQQLVARETISPEEAERIDAEREIRNLNRIVETPKDGEKQVVGRFKKITCSGGAVRYEFESETGPILLTSADFQSISMQILHTGTANLEVGCNAKIENELVVANYRPADEKKLKSLGVLTAVSFVPANFRKMSEEQLNRPLPVVVGGPATDLAENERQIAAEQTEMIQKQQESFEMSRSQSLMDQVTSNLRAIQSGETRDLGEVQTVECSGKNMIAIVVAGGQTLRLSVSQEPQGLHFMSFVRDGVGRFGCRSTFPGLKAVITYLPDTKAKAKINGQLKAIEFVPQNFELQ